jgi:hypothetical protein
MQLLMQAWMQAWKVLVISVGWQIHVKYGRMDILREDHK